MIPDPLPTYGFKVGVRATFGGIRGIPLLALAHNSLSPLLVLFPGRIEYRVLIKTSRPYSQIESIDAYQTLMTNNIRFNWKDRVFTFTANIRDKQQQVALLRFFEDRGLPLTQRARGLLGDS